MSAMKRIWHWLRNQLYRDDLFFRATCFLLGISLGGLGLVMIVAGTSPEFLAELSWFNLLYWPVAGLLTALGALLLARSFIAADWRIAKHAEKYLPDPADLEDAAILFVVILAPAVLLTILLRALGVKGQRTSEFHLDS